MATNNFDADVRKESAVEFTCQCGTSIIRGALKRTVLDRPDQDESDEGSSKRGKTTVDGIIPCPLVHYGCDKEVAVKQLSKHYQTQRHNEAVMKAVQSFVHEIHQIPSLSTTTSENDTLDAAELVESLKVLAEGISSLHEDNVQVHREMIRVKETISRHQQQYNQLKESVEETSRIFQAQQINTTLMQTELASMKQALGDSGTHGSHDGSFIWKISNFSEKMKNAREERVTSIYSPSFYTSSTGYKMCMRLYLNGDGNARGTHLSLFFVLMRGDYDAILQWPFSYKITFCLYDQTPQQRHIVDSFRPDLKSTSFQRPKSSMNIASGIPKFLPLGLVQVDNNPYVRDDCMFIRCLVDTEATPKMMLPYIFAMNPALPNHAQQNMIRKEMEKRQANETNQVLSDPFATSSC